MRKATENFISIRGKKGKRNARKGRGRKGKEMEEEEKQKGGKLGKKNKMCKKKQNCLACYRERENFFEPWKYGSCKMCDDLRTSSCRIILPGV